jgi:uncharacterized membrane protein YfhO
VIRHEPQRVEIEARLAAPGLLVLNDLYDRGWTAAVRSVGGTSTRRVPILRVNRVMRGIMLPVGHHRVTMRYRPRSFYLGAIISGLSWLVLGAAVARDRFAGRLAEAPRRVLSGFG